VLKILSEQVHPDQEQFLLSRRRSVGNLDRRQRHRHLLRLKVLKRLTYKV
jgi:hypothetical protein